MFRRALWLAMFSAAVIASPTAAQSNDVAELAARVSEAELMKTVRDLAGFQGRQTGTLEGEQAAAYLAGRLPEAIRQAFPVQTTRIDHPPKVAILSGGRTLFLRESVDFIPIMNGAPDAALTAAIVFVGYGIAAPSLDEYMGASVSGKIVLFLRGQPPGFAGRVTHADKVRAARAHGAAAYLTVTGPVLSAYEQRRGMGSSPMIYFEGLGEHDLPGLWIAPAVADAILQPTGRTLQAFQEGAAGATVPPAVETGSTMTLEVTRRLVDVPGVNVLASLAGSDPQLRHETIVLGAHYDHFGRQGDLVFPGADDNASGTAVLLEIARVLGSAGANVKRSILFVSFAGEEQGLLGSKYFVSHPPVPLTDLKAMINVDHAGVGNGKLTVGLSKLDKPVAQGAADKAGLGDRVELFGLFPGGDHVPFAEAGIPTATIVSSGAHPDFHRPGDTPEKIDARLLAAVTCYTLSLLWSLANE